MLRRKLNMNKIHPVFRFSLGYVVNIFLLTLSSVLYKAIRSHVVVVLAIVHVANKKAITPESSNCAEYPPPGHLLSANAYEREADLMYAKRATRFNHTASFFE